MLQLYICMIYCHNSSCSSSRLKVGTLQNIYDISSSGWMFYRTSLRLDQKNEIEAHWDDICICIIDSERADTFKSPMWHAVDQNRKCTIFQLYLPNNFKIRFDWLMWDPITRTEKGVQIRSSISKLITKNINDKIMEWLFPLIPSWYPRHSSTAIMV